MELNNHFDPASIESEVWLKRTESRGPHCREDYPAQDNMKWLCCIIAKKVNDHLHLDTLSLDPSWHTRGDEKIGYWG